MTFTYNGVGTRYHGRKNVADRPADCPFCKKPVRLVSYDTRMWFVFVYVPVIPLRKLRILDQCPRCTRHQVIELKRWEKLQDDARNKAGAVVQEKRDDPEAAIEAHKTLLGAHLMTDADALATAMSGRFTTSASVQAYLADFAWLRGKKDEAFAGYERAHALDPDLPGAREGVALSAMQRGDLERALAMLKPVVEGRCVRNPGIVSAVAGGLIRAGRHAEAHAILKTLLELFPALTRDKGFAKQMRACEKALGGPRTKLHVGTMATRRMLVAATVVLLAVAGVVWADRSAAAHIALDVVDSADGNIIVEIPGGGMLEFKKPGRQRLELAAGTYTAHVRGAVQRDIPFTLAPSRWPSFLDEATYVLDASGDTLLWLDEATYAVQKSLRQATRTIVSAGDFQRWPDIDFAFVDLPEELPIPSGQSTVTKSHLSLMQGPPEQAVFDMLARNDVLQAFDFAQKQLARTPDRPLLLQGYVAAAVAGRMQAKADAFLAPRLDARPVDIAAYRAWTSLHATPEEEATVDARFEDRLAAEPDEPAWALLCGERSTSVKKRLQLFARASRDERIAPLAWGPLASAQASAGDWTSALDAAQHALAADANDYAAQTTLVDALIAAGRNDDLETAIHGMLAQEPCNLGALFDLAQLLGATRNDREVSNGLAPYVHKASTACPQDYARVRRALDATPYWARRDYRAVVQQVAGSGDPQLHAWMVCALAEQGSVAELRQFADSSKHPEVEPYTALGVSVACRAAGDEMQARSWEKMALAKLEKTGVDAEVARLLHGDRSEHADEALDLALAPRDKATVLALISFSDEGARTKLLERALELLPPPRFPRATLERLAASTAGH
jgi:tetratricopeptide (TPR) repeat protein